MPRRVKARARQPNVLVADGGVDCFSVISLLLSLYVPYTKIPGLRTISQEPFVEFRPPGYSPPWLTGRKRLQTHHRGDWPQSRPAAELLSGWKIQETPEGSCLGCPCIISLHLHTGNVEKGEVVGGESYSPLNTTWKTLLFVTVDFCTCHSISSWCCWCEERGEDRDSQWQMENDPRQLYSFLPASFVWQYCCFSAVNTQINELLSVVGG